MQRRLCAIHSSLCRNVAEQFAGLGLLCLLLIGSSCAPTFPHRTFTAARTAGIELGMSPEEVSGVFGEPDSIYARTFGEKTDRAWSGLVWEYYMDQDPTYLHCRRALTNSFVFLDEGAAPRLNHWRLESIDDGKRRPVKPPRESRVRGSTQAPGMP